MLVEDDADLRQATVETLELAGFRVLQFAAAVPALAALDPDFTVVTLSVFRMPRMPCLDFLRQVRERPPDISLMLTTARGGVPAAFRALRSRAHDFLGKPCAPLRM